MSMESVNASESVRNWKIMSNVWWSEQAWEKWGQYEGVKIGGNGTGTRSHPENDFHQLSTHQTELFRTAFWVEQEKREWVSQCGWVWSRVVKSEIVEELSGDVLSWCWIWVKDWWEFKIQDKDKDREFKIQDQSVNGISQCEWRCQELKNNE